MRVEGRKGTPVPVTHRGQHYVSIAAFARTFGLNPRLVYDRLYNNIVDDASLLAKRMTRNSPLPPLPGTRSPLWVQTSFGWWRV